MLRTRRASFFRSPRRPRRARELIERQPIEIFGSWSSPAIGSRGSVGCRDKPSGGELFDGGVKGVHKKESPAAVPSLLTSRSPKSSREVTVREGWKGGKSAAINGSSTISFVVLRKRHIPLGGSPSPTQVPPIGTRRGPTPPYLGPLFCIPRRAPTEADALKVIRRTPVQWRSSVPILSDSRSRLQPVFGNFGSPQCSTIALAL